MIWQDVVFMIGGFIFGVALIPAIRSKFSKPPRSSCLSTGCVLYVFCVCYATLGLWLAMISTVLCATAWGVLLFQKRRVQSQNLLFASLEKKIPDLDNKEKWMKFCDFLWDDGMVHHARSRGNPC